MPKRYADSDRPIAKGIKLVGVGRRGSEDLPVSVIEEMAVDLNADLVPSAAKGAFFAGLLGKGVRGEEIALFRIIGADPDRPASLLKALCPQLPEAIEALCRGLLEGRTLTVAEAQELGGYLLSDESDEAVCGIVASWLRVRYETPEEYEGLLKAIEATIQPQFRQTAHEGVPLIQIAEPFDGVDHSYLMTPLLGKYLASRSFRVVHVVGRNSGPKWVFNLADLCADLDLPRLKSETQLSQPVPETGWYAHQEDVSPALDRWVDLRRQTIKRPFLSTLEKFVNPWRANILITSAFHPPYGEKMVDIAERAGYPKVIVIRNGIEGGVAFPLKRAARVMVSRKRSEGSYQRMEFDFDASVELGIEVDVEQRLDPPRLKDNSYLIRNHLQSGCSGDRLFDLKVEATCRGIEHALSILEEE